MGFATRAAVLLAAATLAFGAAPGGELGPWPGLVIVTVGRAALGVIVIERFAVAAYSENDGM